MEPRGDRKKFGFHAPNKQPPRRSKSDEQPRVSLNRGFKRAEGHLGPEGEALNDHEDRRQGFFKRSMGGWLGGRSLEIGQASSGQLPDHKALDNAYEGRVAPEKSTVPSEKTRFHGGATSVGEHDGAIVADAVEPPVAAPILGGDTALLVICALRPNELERTLAAVEKFYPGRLAGGASGMPIVISQDGTNPAVVRVIANFQESMKECAVVVHLQHPSTVLRGDGYVKLSAHYAWALTQVFDDASRGDDSFIAVDKVIILEDDLEIAPDFFDYFAATAPLLDSDETLMGISAWNDNGQGPIVQDNEAVYRSDFFPGLGWMLPRRIWYELQPIWPKAYWDDWLREPARRKGRQFIRPEVCRTYHFGKSGTSKNQFASHLDGIKLNKDPVAFREMDMSFLEPERFQEAFVARVQAASIASVDELIQGQCAPGDVRLVYTDEKDFGAIARRLGIMADFKAGAPRTAYMKVVTLWWKETKVFVTPKEFGG